ncbi:hypothetical protein GCM10007416_12370 [Kroppenstedtia guangzhouensis]|uniref:Uncharacterized protein n=1 Tax=Kroppenstedtia guangzhouensis TaxID=1274356 RepID=A0ABQ1GCA9_9BACL|nr:hypothetical protein [Kroppenstedtia guangzhouensis]GGA40908.1 hypothetical protein GCM10007416_12370 [Kroppenstedtia guangzhouensis]
MPAEHLQAASERSHRLVNELTRQQQADGRWIFCFESGPMTDAYMLLLYEIFGTTGKKSFGKEWLGVFSPYRTMGSGGFIPMKRREAFQPLWRPLLLW